MTVLVIILLLMFFFMIGANLDLADKNINLKNDLENKIFDLIDEKRRLEKMLKQNQNILNNFFEKLEDSFDENGVIEQVVYDKRNDNIISTNDLEFLGKL